jgi:hypothetical protein
MTIWQRWKQTSLHNKALVFSGIIVAFGTLFYSGAAIVQVWMFNRSSRQVERQTERLIAAANTQAGAAKEMTAAVKEQAKSAGDFAQSAKNINEQTALAVKNFGRMAKASEDNIKATQEASRLDQRAWISTSVSLPAVTDLDKATTVTIGVSNTGKTFALKVNYLSSLSVYKDIPQGVDYYAALTNRTGIKSVGVIAPNRGYSTKLNIPESGFKALDKLVTKDWYVMIWGYAEYRDAFKNTPLHHTHFYVIRKISESREDLDQCGFHNDAD